MRDYYRENLQLYLILFVWLLSGVVGGPISYVVIPLTMFLMKGKNMYEELFIGYFFILILSDSLETSLLFAKGVKNIYISLLAVFFFLDLKSFEPLNKLNRIFLPFFIFAVIAMLTSAIDPFFFTSLQKTVSYIISFLIVPNFISKIYREQGAIFFRRFILFMVTTLLVGLFLKYAAHSVAYLAGGRFRGVLGNPNGLGIYCLLFFILFFLINDFYPDLFTKYERIIIYVIILYSLFLTDSRNAILALLIFYLFQRFFSMSPFLGFLFFLISLVAAEIVTSNITSIVLALGLGDFFRINTLEDGSGRYIAWNFAWRQIQNNFFIGKGFAYDEYFMRRHYAHLEKLGHQGGIHNSFLTFWMDQGLVGLIVYLRSYILLFIKAARKTKYAFPIMFAITFSAVFESWLVGSLSAFAFLAMFIFTFISSDEIKPNETNVIKEIIPEPITSK